MSAWQVTFHLTTTVEAPNGAAADDIANSYRMPEWAETVTTEVEAAE